MLKMELTLDPHATPDERRTLAALMRSLADAFAEPVLRVQPVSDTATVEAFAPAAPAARRTRGAAKPDPVAAYVEAGGSLPGEPAAPGTLPDVELPPAEGPYVTGISPAAAVLVEELKAAEVVATTLEADVKTAEANADGRTIEQLREAMRDVAKVEGALWLRPHLHTDKVAKISALTESTMRAALVGRG